MSRRWILSLLVAIGAISAVAGATAASADFRGGVHGGEVLDRVASILGIEREELDDAFAEARSEVQDEKQADALTALVENETITQDEADAIGDWLDARPVAVDGIKAISTSVFKFHNGGVHPTSALNIPSISPELLDRLVEADKLSREDADAIQAWLDSRPDAVDKLVTSPLRTFEGFGEGFEGIAPFGGRGFFRFDGDQERLELEGLREQLELFRSELEGLGDGELPDFPGFEIPEDGFFQFGGDGFEFEFRGDGPGFFFRGGRGHEGFPRFHDFIPQAPESSDNPEPVNL